MLGALIGDLLSPHSWDALGFSEACSQGQACLADAVCSELPGPASIWPSGSFLASGPWTHCPGLPMAEDRTGGRPSAVPLSTLGSRVARPHNLIKPEPPSCLSCGSSPLRAALTPYRPSAHPSCPGARVLPACTALPGSRDAGPGLTCAPRGTGLIAGPPPTLWVLWASPGLKRC